MLNVEVVFFYLFLQNENFTLINANQINQTKKVKIKSLRIRMRCGLHHKNKHIHSVSCDRIDVRWILRIYSIRNLQ